MIDKPMIDKSMIDNKASKSMNFCNTTLAAGSLICLSGCNPVAIPDLMSTGSVFGTAQSPAFEHTIAEKRSPGEAFLRLPDGAGQILDVTQKRYGNGAEQLIIYRGDLYTRGQNAARVKLVLPRSRFGKRPENLTIDKTAHAQIRNELDTTLPGISMVISNHLHTNAYGPFGYALGGAGSKVKCIYGWQNMSGRESDRWAHLRGESAKPKLSVRLRVCRGDTSTDQLVDLMRNLRVEAEPGQVLKPQPVAWSAGSGADLSLAMPNYEPGGYISGQNLVAPEPVIVSRHAPVPRLVTRKVRKAVDRNQIPPSVDHPASRHVYSPPLPKSSTASGQNRPDFPKVQTMPRPKVIAPPLVTAQSRGVPGPVPISYNAPSPVPPATKVVRPSRADPKGTSPVYAAVPLPY